MCLNVLTSYFVLDSETFKAESRTLPTVHALAPNIQGAAEQDTPLRSTRDRPPALQPEQFQP